MGTACSCLRCNSKQTECVINASTRVVCVHLPYTHTQTQGQEHTHTQANTRKYLACALKTHTQTKPNKHERDIHMHTQALSVTASARHVWGYGMINRTPYRWPHWGERGRRGKLSSLLWASLSGSALSPHWSLLTLTTLSLSCGRFMSGFHRFTVLARCQHDPH